MRARLGDATGARPWDWHGAGPAVRLREERCGFEEEEADSEAAAGGLGEVNVAMGLRSRSGVEGRSGQRRRREERIDEEEDRKAGGSGQRVADDGGSQQTGAEVQMRSDDGRVAAAWCSVARVAVRCVAFPCLAVPCGAAQSSAVRCGAVRFVASVAGLRYCSREVVARGRGVR